MSPSSPAFPCGMVRKSRPPHDPGADFHVTDILSPANQGMTLRQYAAIKLRVPDSGTDWLDAMIERSVMDDFAEKAMAAMITSPDKAFSDDSGSVCAIKAYQYADRMMKAREA